MTHDKLLDKIEAIDYWQEHFANRTFLKALRAVVELHKPYGDIMCEVCEGVNYPCSTIALIMEKLNG